MFSYYGSKSKLVHLYPPPACARLIEPFAGSARYALRYWQRDVWINDANPTIAAIWHYLQRGTRRRIERLPEPQPGQDLRELRGLSQTERDLLGFAVNMGVASPHYVYTTWAARQAEVKRLKARMLAQLEHVRHWRITCLDYRELPNPTATWFVDPPYVDGGERYPLHDLDYRQLAAWSRGRRGQLIVCENGTTRWLPFRTLRVFTGQRRTTTERVFLSPLPPLPRSPLPARARAAA